MYTKIVRASGGADATSIDNGSSLAGDNSTLLVKSGSYTETVTLSNDNQKVVVERGSTITGNVTLSGANVTLVLGAGCNVVGVITLSGDGCSLYCKNGVDIDGISISGEGCYVSQSRSDVV